MLLINESLAIADRDGVVRLRIGVDDKPGRPYISFHDTQGLERLMLSIDEDGNGGISFLTADGQPVLSLGVSSETGMGIMALDVPTDTCLTFSITDGRGEIRLESRQNVYLSPPSEDPTCSEKI